jgi:hypothetical protein
MLHGGGCSAMHLHPSHYNEAEIRRGGKTFIVVFKDPEVVCTVRLAIGFLLVLSKWCAQSRLAFGF